LGSFTLVFDLLTLTTGDLDKKGENEIPSGVYITSQLPSSSLYKVSLYI
jgi:hypothetical protein